MDQELDRDQYYSYPSSQRQNLLQVLETVADLLQDDFMSAVSALTMCTEQLAERLNKLCRVHSPTDSLKRFPVVSREMHQRYGAERQAKENTGTFCGSLAGGFTPRILR